MLLFVALLATTSMVAEGRVGGGGGGTAATHKHFNKCRCFPGVILPTKIENEDGTITDSTSDLCSIPYCRVDVTLKCGTLEDNCYDTEEGGASVMAIIVLAVIALIIGAICLACYCKKKREDDKFLSRA